MRKCCWDDPCTCGEGYEHYTWLQFAEFIGGILSYREKDEAIKILNKALDIVKNKIVKNKK